MIAKKSWARMTEQNMNYRTPCRKPIGSYLPWKLFISPTFFFYQGQHDISEGLNAVVTKLRISLSARSNASGSSVLPYRKEIVIIMGRDRAIKSSKIVIIGLSRDGMMWASKHNSIYMYMYGISDIPRERYILSAILI